MTGGDNGEDWAGGRDRPGLFFQVRDGWPRFGPGCAILAIVASVAAVIVLVLAVRLVIPLLGDVRLR